MHQVSHSVEEYLFLHFLHILLYLCADLKFLLQFKHLRVFADDFAVFVI
jgi:hypothetical protein